jgi:NAD-dependent dihydropyrimidine dehydrogenase PreA subunit
MEKEPNKKMMKDYQIKVNKDMCIACGKCVMLCPLDNFEMIEDQYVKTKGNCTFCLRCINECPSYVIRFFNEKGQSHINILNR